MKRMPDNYVDLILTSPPYDNMRSYGGNKNYHQRLNDTGFSFDFEDIAKELTRVLKPGGVIMWNIQDQTIKGTRTGNSMRQALYFMEECKLLLWDHLIWYKTGTPFPSPYRYRNVWENMFILTKGKPNTFNPILKKNKSGGASRNRRRERNHNGELEIKERVIKTKEYGIDDNVWYITNHFKINDEMKKYGHPAVMTDEVARRHIQSWTNEGDVVYDPFLGAATTTRIAKEMNRNWIGSEIHQPYFDISKKIMSDEFISETQSIL
jgi:site-specific DNA-methyltransferase (adenine-specific)